MIITSYDDDDDDDDDDKTVTFCIVFFRWISW